MYYETFVIIYTDVWNDDHQLSCNDKGVTQILHELPVTYLVLSAGILVQFIPLA